MSNPNFNQPLYDATVQALAENGVPMEVAEAASKVVASDDPYQENLGRSPQEQQVVNEAMTYFHKSLGQTMTEPSNEQNE